MNSIKKKDCNAPNCNRSSFRHSLYCERHNKQLKLFGRIRTEFVRSKKEPNEIIVEQNIGRILLYNEFGEVIKETIIDINQIDKVKKYKWTFDGRYAININNRLYLHHLIFNFQKEKGRFIDHKNGNGLDNRLSNLRSCTQAQNLWNRTYQINNKIGYKGVSWCNKRNKWRVAISFNDTYKHIGYFHTIKEAVEAHRKACIQYHGKFAYPEHHKEAEYAEYGGMK